MPNWYDTQGRPITDLLAWAKLFDERSKGDDRWWKVAQTPAAPSVEVSTVWLGLDHNWYGGPPHIFETMIFGGSLDGWQRRYSTWEQAEEGHVELVKEARWQWHCDDLHDRAIARLRP